MDFLEKLTSGERIAARATLVLAHPDDETASTGGLLQRLDNSRLIYLTDGAPRDLVDARREGFDQWRSYAELRKRELGAALQILDFRSEPAFCDVPDKQALEHLPQLVERLRGDLVEKDIVLTHAYEHGHPDHDTAAVAVALACKELGRNAPQRAEFAGYHLGQEEPVFGAFWACGEEVAIHLSPEELRRKQAALQAYASQSETLAQFPISPERFRRAPDYDFTSPAPPQRALYDLYGWQITGSEWRARLAELLA